MKKIIQGISLTLFFALLFSCENEFVVDTDNSKALLVLNCTFSPDSSLIVNLSTTKSPFKKDSFDIVDDATITINDGNSIFTEFEYLKNGNYLLNSTIDENSIFNIAVSYQDYPEISSESYIPLNISIDSFSNEISFNNENEKVLQTEIEFSTDEDVYLVIRHIVKKKSLSIDNDTISFVDTVWINSMSSNFDNVLPEYAANDILFARIEGGKKHKLLFHSFDGFVKDSKLIEGVSIFEMVSCSKDYYEYQKSKQLYVWNEKENNSSIINPQNLHSNINNGLGIFAGFNKKILTNKYK